MYHTCIHWILNCLQCTCIHVKQYINVSYVYSVLLYVITIVLIANKMCGLQAEPGNCQGSFPSYFYNTATEECEMFIYSGCGGNQNKFSDIDSCRRTCSGMRTICLTVHLRLVIHLDLQHPLLQPQLYQREMLFLLLSVSLEMT